ncbi:MAG: hypothetical protein Kow0058_03820 [Roseovarius sp.]
MWGTAVKKTIAIFAVASILIAGAAIAAHAGSLSDPVVTPEVVAADTVATASHPEMIVAALAIIVIILGTAGAF